MARVLVIDDCREFRDFARFVLEGEGLEVIEARDALAGLQRAVEDGPDLVLVALDLDGLDGLEVAARLAGDPSTRDTPVLLTGPEALAVGRPVALREGLGIGLPHDGGRRSLRDRVRAQLPVALPESALTGPISRIA